MALGGWVSLTEVGVSGTGPPLPNPMLRPLPLGCVDHPQALKLEDLPTLTLSG